MKIRCWVDKADAIRRGVEPIEGYAYVEVSVATLTQEQIRAIIAEEIRNLSDTLIAEPFVTVGNSALLTNERALTGTAGRISVTDGGAGGAVTIDATGAALTRVDDTNVTLTLGGAPTTALVNAASLTLGWTGQLAVGRGGTGVATFTVNGVLYGNTASAIQVTAQGAANTVLTANAGSPAFSATPTVTTVNTTTGYNQSGTQVVGAQGAAVADAAVGATIDAEARTAINAWLARARTHGLIAT